MNNHNSVLLSILQNIKENPFGVQKLEAPENKLTSYFFLAKEEIITEKYAKKRFIRVLYSYIFWGR